MSIIPDDPQSITAEWLSKALGAPVAKSTLVDAHAGTTGRAILELEPAAGAELPRRLFVKLPPTDELQRQFVVSSGMGQREVQFYRQLSAEVPVRVPHCYFAECSEAGDQYIMLLEHLEDSDCTFRNASTRYSADYIRQVLASFAKMHAAYWESPRFDADLGWLQPPLQHEIAPPLIQLALETHVDSMPAVFRQMGELYLDQTDAIHEVWRRGAPTLIHGDVHDANLFYSDGQPGFLDWAIAGRGPALRDVGYFLAATLEPDDQVAWGRDMLTYYRDQLRFCGVDAPPEAELWQQYQWHAAYVWVGSAVTLAMGEAWQPMSYVLSSLEKLHAAMETLGSVEAIKQAI